MNQEQLILALDAAEESRVWQLVEKLTPEISFWKVGLELFYGVGPGVVTELNRRGQRIFLDLKLHDIPNTVAGACRVVERLGVDFLTLHASGGADMLAAARQALTGERTRLLAVTLLTSLSESQLQRDLGFPGTVRDYVLHSAKIAQAQGCAGVICSPQEAAAVRAACGPDFLIVTPGIRLGQDHQDQARACTPQAALAAGANYLVLGRTITAQSDPAKSLRQLLQSS